MVLLTTRPCHVDIKFDDITHAVTIRKTQKVILNHISGCYEHGKLHAIMGPSGAGKSSLLNILAGLNATATGTITMNKNERYTVAKWSTLVSSIRSYMLQDDFIVPELTVRETLEFAAAMKFPDGNTKSRSKVIDLLLKQVGLSEMGHRPVRALSGGERKRVAVASELVNYRPVLFLDEPTTGLDSTSCYRLIDLLKSVALAGCNVIAAIHQPSSRVFNMFDTLTVLSNDGTLAFSGPPSALVGAIERLTKVKVAPLVNPADVLFEGRTIRKMGEAAAEDRRKAIDEAIADTNRPQQDDIGYRFQFASLEGDHARGISRANEKQSQEVPRTDSYVYLYGTAEETIKLCEENEPTRGVQFRTLFTRAVVQTQRDKVFFIGRIVAFFIILGCTGLVFQFVGNDASKTYSNIAFIYLLSKIFMVGTAIVTVMNTPIHLNILLRENINNWYSLSAFYWTRAFIEAAVNFAISFTFPIGVWMITSQPQVLSYALPCLVFILCIHTIATHHFAFTIAMFADIQSLPQLPFAVAMMHVLFGGYFIPLRDLPVWISWLQYIDCGAFTNYALLKLAYSPVTSIAGNTFDELPCAEPLHPLCSRFKTGHDVLTFWGIDINTHPMWLDVIWLCLYMFIIIFLNWALLALYLSRARRAIARV